MKHIALTALALTACANVQQERGYSFAAGYAEGTLQALECVNDPYRVEGYGCIMPDELPVTASECDFTMEDYSRERGPRSSDVGDAEGWAAAQARGGEGSIVRIDKTRYPQTHRTATCKYMETR